MDSVKRKEKKLSYLQLNIILLSAFPFFVICNYAGYFDPILGPEKRCFCGIANYPDERIVGGSPANANEFPWMVALYNAFGFQFCGGSLISNKFVLTAAHCVEFKDPLGVIVGVGEHDISVYSSKVRKIGVERVILHPRYVTFNYVNDIALLKMEENITFDESKRTACFPRPGIDYTNKMVTVVGWGLTSEDGSSSNVLRKVSVLVFSLKHCQEAFGKYVVASTVICAGSVEGGKDSCEGDSGGPIMAEIQSRWYLIGIVSAGFGCARPNYPAYYTRVDKYYEWIDKNTKDSQFCNN